MEKLKKNNTRLDRSFDKLRAREEAGLIKTSNMNRQLRKMLNNKLAVSGLIIFSIIVLASIFAPLICKYDPLMINLKEVLNAPSMDHILGTDRVGRDIFSRIVFGGRVSILVGLGSALGAALIGVSLGCYAG